MSDFSSNFINLEYCISQYFDKHMAQSVVQAKKYLDRKQAEETDAFVGSRNAIGNFVNPAMNIAMGVQDANRNGKYHQVHTEELVQGIIKQFSKDQRLTQDIRNMTDLWRASAVAQVGEERYRQLSAQCPSGDLASQYMNERISSLIIDRLAKMDLPKSSLEYILTEGGKGSLIGIVANWTVDNSSTLDNEVRRRTKEMYDPSTGEKLSAEAVSFVLDGWAAAGKAPAAAAKFFAGDAAIRGGGYVLGNMLDKGQTGIEEFVGERMFGNSNAFSSFREDAKGINPHGSEDLQFLNACLNKKVFKSHVNQNNVKDVRGSLITAVGDNGNDLLLRVRKGFSSYGIKVKDGPVPEWIGGMTDKNVIRTAAHYAAYALEMKAKNVSQLKVGNKIMTLQEVAQRAYDYARAANERYSTRQTVSAGQDVQPRVSHDVTAGADPNLRPAVQVTYSQDQQEAFRQQFQQHYGQGFVPAAAAGQSVSMPDFGGWSGFFDKIGLSGMSSLGSGLGSTIAMLPELMVGMFTGKMKGFTMKDNMLPLGLLMMSLLFGRRMNPLLKFMMLGLGGAMLLNNANKVVHGEAGSDVHPQKSYRRYEDEPLSPRLSNVELKGNTILADVDGVPTILTIRSDQVLDAYNKGAIPLNTLCNAVLRSYDQMEVRASENYERVAAQEQEFAQQQEEAQDQTRGIR